MRPFDDYHGGGYTMLPKLKGAMLDDSTGTGW